MGGNLVTLLFGECGERKNVGNGRLVDRVVGKHGLSTCACAVANGGGNVATFAKEEVEGAGGGLIWGKVEA